MSYFFETLWSALAEFAGWAVSSTRNIVFFSASALLIAVIIGLKMRNVSRGVVTPKRPSGMTWLFGIIGLLVGLAMPVIATTLELGTLFWLVAALYPVIVVVCFVVGLVIGYSIDSHRIVGNTR